ncbi:aldehyde dehydrogenase family protein, partial [Luteimonas sp. RIT-PG2_3]
PPTVTPELLAQAEAFMARRQQLFIGGEWSDASSAGVIDTENPATGQVIGQIAAATQADVDRAVAAARAAFDGDAWRAIRPGARSRLLARLADVIEAHADELALLESLDNGMPFFNARFFSIQGAIENLRYNAGWPARMGGDTTNISFPGEWHTYTLREPLGVAALIVPWNMPLVMAANKIGTALAAGCTVVLKPAELTSLSAVRFFELAQQVGFPPGVINLVTGLGAEVGAALAAHADVDKVSFTGSTAVGKSIIAASAGNLKRVTLELGGKSPTFIFGDADLEPAIAAAARSIFGNTGQVCVAGSRLFVHRRIFDQVVEGVSGIARKLRLGPGTEPGVEIGPLISARQLERVTGYIDSGRQDGAEVVVGGQAVDGSGHFIQPTVLTGTDPSMKVMREEIFGPVLCAVPFDDADELQTLADRGNDTEYGLSASIWTRDISTAHKLAQRLKAGTVRVNTPVGIDFSMPFGGYKQSGWGRENGREGVEAYTELKSVFVGL